MCRKFGKLGVESKAGARGISIALLIQSLDRTLLGVESKAGAQCAPYIYSHLEAGARGISIALPIQSLDRTLQTTNCIFQTSSETQ